MIDTEMLDGLAQKKVVIRDSRPVGLEDIFSRVVADGWAPRTPAYGDELSRLAASTARGVCLNPLIVEGDTLYIDPNTPALPGDLVSFALSNRGAEAQNSYLPPGQSPWKKGDRWTKLYAQAHGFGFLLEKYGASATTTMMGGEHPEDEPRLSPVRNIRRNGRLLFTPDSHSSQIGLNAATDLNFISDDSTYSTTFAANDMATTYPGVSLTNPYVTSPILNFTASVSQSVIVTATGTIYFTNTSPATIISQAWIGVALIDTTNPVANVLVGYSPHAGVTRSFNNISSGGSVTTSPSPTQQFAFQMEESVTQGHTYAVLVFCQTAQSDITAETTSVQLQVETVKR